MCNCIERIEKQLTEKMVELNNGAEIIDNVEFVNKTWTFGKQMNEFLGNPVLGKYRVGKAVRKFDTQMLPSYCPFCGEKFEKEKSSTGQISDIN